MSASVDKLLEDIADKADQLEKAKARVAELQVEFARAAARLVVEAGLPPGDAAPAAEATPALPPPARTTVRPARKPAPRGARKRPARAPAVRLAAAPAKSQKPRHGGVEAPTLREEILGYIGASGGWAEALEVIRVIGGNAASVRRTMGKMTAAGELVRRGETSRAVYVLANRVEAFDEREERGDEEE